MLTDAESEVVLALVVRSARLERSFKAGDFGALIEAVRLFAEAPLPLPQWVADAAGEVLIAVYRKQPLPGEGRGRAKGYRSKAKAARVHAERWRAVNAWKQAKQHLPQAGYPATFEGVLQAASDRLKGSFAQGEPPTIRESYQLVRDECKAGRGALYFGQSATTKTIADDELLAQILAIDRAGSKPLSAPSHSAKLTASEKGDQLPG
jgi:hypothetical protein